jgi:hypothetical protein
MENMIADEYFDYTYNNQYTQNIIHDTENLILILNNITNFFNNIIIFTKQLFYNYYFPRKGSVPIFLMMYVSIWMPFLLESYNLNSNYPLTVLYFYSILLLPFIIISIPIIIIYYLILYTILILFYFW